MPEYRTMRNKAIVRCRFRPQHPLHEELARLGSNRRPGDDAVTALACTRRLGDVSLQQYQHAFIWPIMCKHGVHKTGIA